MVSPTTTEANAAGANTTPSNGSGRKKLDPRILTLIQNTQQSRHRSFFVVVGDHGRDQVVNLHFLLSKQRVSRPSVLWCYKKELGFSSHREKRAKQIKRAVARGIRSVDEDDPFELFVSSTEIRYCYYKETEKVLGRTFGMLVLQDFEAITPNLLARTLETVEGGGMIVLLLKTMNSLKQLYNMSMDVHARYRTSSHGVVVPRFNERFILSLGDCHNCLVVDDTLTVLPISKGKSIKPTRRLVEEELTEQQRQLVDLKSSLKETPPIGPILQLTKTIDQATTLLSFLDILSSKSLRSTLSLTAARGRGKSALLGLSIAAAIAYGYSNIFLTSPSPENLGTLWEFIFKGFDALGYQEHLDYDLTQATTADKSILRVNVFRDHRQTIQYIHPQDSNFLGSAELLVIDEAAAIPLPLVKKLLGNYLVFLSSTINGYEGTGRSLSLKLLKELRENSVGFNKSTESTTSSTSAGGRSLKELQLSTPIRYDQNDPVESWLNKLLCLDCCNLDASPANKTPSTLHYSLPHPSQCELFFVNRDTLFSYHPVSEKFLQKIMGLYVSSHYKNSPNDLMLMSDAPAHQLFVLLPPVTDQSKAMPLPEPLCVIQITLEGQISKQTILNSLARGKRLDGDLIPWCISQQYQDDEFGSLSGGRIVRIATNPDFAGMGYGSRAMELLTQYYEGNMISTSENETGPIKTINRDLSTSNDILHTESIGVRDASSLPPLLSKLADVPLKTPLHWLGVSYGLTPSLHKFWKRGGFVPVYLRQTANDLTGEHTCIMLRNLRNTDVSGGWLVGFAKDFRRRFLELLAYQFRVFGTVTVLSMLDGINRSINARSEEHPDLPELVTADDVHRIFTPYDLKRLESYGNNMLDYHVVLDLIPLISKAYFMGKFSKEAVKLSPSQAGILVGVGLQHKTLEDLEKEFDLNVNQLMAHFIKLVKKVSGALETVVKSDIEKEQETKSVEAIKKRKIEEVEHVPGGTRDINNEEAWDPTRVGLDDDLADAESEVKSQLREEQRELINSLNLDQYVIPTKADFSDVKTSVSGGEVVSVKNPSSSRAKKMKTGLASELAAKEQGDGVYDPKGLIKKKKKSKK